MYNRVNSIQRAVNSVKSQNYPDIEHIVVDGGSTDGTLQKLRLCLGEKAILISERDKGIYDAINKGLRLATGDVIGLLHSDDFFADNNVLSEVLIAFRDASVDAVYGDAAFFHTKNPQKIVRLYSSRFFVPSLLSWGWMPAHTTLFIRRDAHLKIGEYKANYKIAADFDFMCRAFVVHGIKYKYIQKIFTKMQLGGISSSNFANTLTLNREVFRACRENNIDTNYCKIISKYPMKILEFFPKFTISFSRSPD